MRLLGFMAVTLVAACTVYVPHPVDEPLPPGTNIRARLNAGGAVRVSAARGRTIDEVEGEILALGPDSLQIALLNASEYERPWEGLDSLRLAISEIGWLEEKKIDPTRTAVLVAGVGTATGVVIAALFRAANRSKGEEGGDGDLALIPLFSLSW